MTKIAKRGQTILEAVIAVVIIVAITTGLVAVTVKALKASQFARNKSLAIKYAQEGVELSRNLRNTLDWTEFKTMYGNKTYCLDGNGSFTYPCVTTAINVANIFSRYVNFALNDTTTTMRVEVHVSWVDAASVTHDSQLITDLSQLQ